MKRIAGYGMAVWLMAVGTVWADSLYKADEYSAWVADHPAFRPGDNLTVLITEIASVSTSANTSTNKSGSASGALTGTRPSGNFALNLEDEFNGGGTIERQGKFLAQLTVAVQSVDENGDLWVKGEQEIEVNNERQWIALEGRVRLRDIRSDNTVLSSRVGDARIKYVGKGVLAEKQRPGILTRILGWLWIL
jgi:flagellar L-ring protein FlgH